MENNNDARLTALLEAFVSLTLTLVKQHNLDLNELNQQLGFSIAGLRKRGEVTAAETLDEWSQALKEDAEGTQFQDVLERGRARRAARRPPADAG